MRSRQFPLAGARVGLALLAALSCRASRAETIRATPGDYGGKVRQLKPGDTLLLEAGQYAGLLRLVGLHGRAGEPITIAGPDKPLEAVFVGRSGANTLELTDSSWIVIRKLTFDGKDVADDAIKANDAQRRPVHHIVLEDNTILNHGRRQTYVGINAQVPCWDWVIRGNIILGAGTGMYLGSSEGTFPFVRGLIEYNLVQNPKGYCLQIKHQNGRPALEGIPTEPSATILRYNVFAKNDARGELGDRPNVLIDGLPDAGPGSADRYHVYGNVFLSNPREALFQGTGRISLHDNLFVSSQRPAVAIQPHSGKDPRSIRIYHNTILTDGEAIKVGGARTGAEVFVAANLIASDMVRPTARVRMGSNIFLGLWEASALFASPASRIERLDLQPKQRLAVPFPADKRKVLEGDVDSGLDLAGNRKGDWGYCGAFCEALASPRPVLTLAGPDAPRRN